MYIFYIYIYIFYIYIYILYIYIYFIYIYIYIYAYLFICRSSRNSNTKRIRYICRRRCLTYCILQILITELTSINISIFYFLNSLFSDKENEEEIEASQGENSDNERNDKKAVEAQEGS